MTGCGFCEAGLAAPFPDRSLDVNQFERSRPLAPRNAHHPPDRPCAGELRPRDPHTEAAAATFYGKLFTLEPDTRSLFRNDMAEQGRKLFLTLATVVDALDRLDTIVPVAHELAIRHVAYGAKVRHYDAVGIALIETLRGALGPMFDADTEAAWGVAYRILSETMQAAARRAA